MFWAGYDAASSILQEWKDKLKLEIYDKLRWKFRRNFCGFLSQILLIEIYPYRKPPKKLNTKLTVKNLK